ncbi:MAG: TrmB family transcriptional regulator [Nitrososphaeria archaeon]
MVTEGFDSSLSEREKLLEDYGLSRRQIRIYLMLLLSGPLKLSELAYKVGLYRMQVYITLKQLIQLGLVEATLGRPTLYGAVSPKKALNLLLEDISTRLERAKERQAFLLEDLASIARTASLSFTLPRFRVIQGRRQFIRVAKESCRHSKLEINNINTLPSVRRGITVGFDELLEGCVRRGVKVRWIVTDVVPRKTSEIKYCEFGEVRYLRIDCNIRLMIVDGFETFMSSLYDDSLDTKTEGEATIHVRDRNISMFINQCFNSLWKDAKPMVDHRISSFAQ